ncbi:MULTISPECIES: hypothetical protein [Gracilibacillus]|uniref:hypothetical protein n=1 Tax=Gracilibacillus TaxID=74385 RepID=UPI0008258E89|nr:MULTISPECIES: hypothetical protein [Gracilibacillus]
MKKILMFLSVVTMCILSLSIGFLTTTIDGTKQVANEDHIKNESIEISAEWESEPESIEDLYKNSDLVVVATTKTKKDNDGNDRTIMPFPNDNTVVYTEYDLKVKTLLKGDLTEKNKKIDLINYGGKNNEGVNVDWENIIELKDGQLYLLFLEKMPHFSEMKNDPRSGKYRPISGPMGAYMITKSDKQNIDSIIKQSEIKKQELIEGFDLSVEEEVTNIQKKVVKEGFEGVVKNSK